MERYVESLRPSRTTPADKRQKQGSVDETDVFEQSHHGSLRIPKSVLDGCEESFTAADSRRVKASTQFFDETALMASHQRIYTLDRQVNHLTTEVQMNLGSWLQRRFLHAQRKKTAAEDILKSCGKSLEYLREQWKAQVKAQTKPLPRQSKGAGKTAVTELMRLRETRDELRQQIKGMNSSLVMDQDMPSDVHVEIMTDLHTTKTLLQELELKITRKERLLGVSERAELKQLITNPYIHTMMNALAVKERLRDRLRSRKFELENVERSFRKQVNDQKVDNHTEASVKRRDPSIAKLALTYNKLQASLVNMIKTRKAPPGAVAPHKIETKGLFALDVDDAIWQDIGLAADEESINVTPPAWLADESVRSGIKAVLEHDRCVEELERLRQECRSMRLWLSEEWATVNAEIASSLTEGWKFYMGLRRDKLLRYCIKWQDAVDSLFPEDQDSYSDWGPSKEDVAAARTFQVLETVYLENREDEDSEDDSDDDDMVLTNTLDALELADSFRAVTGDEYLLD
ncbi:hypothetical protein H0H92_008576 [Tricholoma furcatifolium]|nr:hypothetical protein H0H92_008576 [Tricholoma furcatifolium]